MRLISLAILFVWIFQIINGAPTCSGGAPTKCDVCKAGRWTNTCNVNNGGCGNNQCCFCQGRMYYNMLSICIDILTYKKNIF